MFKVRSLNYIISAFAQQSSSVVIVEILCVLRLKTLAHCFLCQKLTNGIHTFNKEYDMLDNILAAKDGTWVFECALKHNIEVPKKNVWALWDKEARCQRSKSRRIILFGI